jgi:hypothetical protein
MTTAVRTTPIVSTLLSTVISIIEIIIRVKSNLFQLSYLR